MKQRHYRKKRTQETGGKKKADKRNDRGEKGERIIITRQEIKDI